MQKTILSVTTIIIIGFFLTGCSTPVSRPQKYQPRNGNLVGYSFEIANRLENNLKSPIPQDAPLIVASFVDVSDLEKSSIFGRIIAEQIGSQFSQKGYRIIEMKLRQKSIFIDKEKKGEFMLSRDLRDITTNHNIAAVIVGTYGCGSEQVYVSARIVDPVSSVVLASCDISIPMYGREQDVMMKN